MAERRRPASNAGRLREVLLGLVASAVILGAAWVAAPASERSGDGVATFLPTADSQVVEQLPRRAGTPRRELREARLALERRPDQVPLAIALARQHLADAQREGDPRSAGHAQAALAHWWSDPRPPVEIALLRAAIKQHQHDFEGALDDLQQVIEREPRNIQAWLSRASIEQTIGRIGDAAASCRMLVEQSDHVVGHVCLADVESLTGSRDAFARLQKIVSVRTLQPAERSWVLTVQAEMAERAGLDVEAERLFRAAVAAGGSLYTRAAYADYLLDRRRFADVGTLLADAPATDALRVRHAIALKRSGDARADAAARELRERFESARLREDAVHLREMARFALEVEGDAERALALAKRNWSVQKEPADTLLLLQAAAAAGRPGDADEARRFVAAHRLVDVRMDAYR